MFAARRCATMHGMTLTPDDSREVARFLCRALDPLMTSHGFIAGQAGFSSSTIGVVYCTEHRDFRSRFPTLAPDIQDPDGGACTDLNISVGTDGPVRLRRVELDGHTLRQLADDVSRDDLRSHISRLYDVGFEEGVTLLHQVVTAILATAAELSRSKNRHGSSPS